MSDNITVTGNEAQFNEDATFLKDVHIKGKIYYDDLEGADDNFKVDNLIVNNKGEFELNINLQERPTSSQIPEGINIL